MPTKTKTKTKAPTVSVTVAKFTDANRPFEVLRDGQPLKEFVACHEGDYRAKGINTPLRDSTARFIAHLDQLRSKKRVVIGLLADESGSMAGRDAGVIAGINEFVEGMTGVEDVDTHAAGKVLCVIITDGLENASREVSPGALQAMIAEREADGWTFIYLGANQDAWAAGTSYGLSGGATGQTVTMASSSPQAFNAALRTTGKTHGSQYLADNKSYLAASASFASRTIAEDGTEETTVKPYGDVADAVKQAKEATK